MGRINIEIEEEVHRQIKALCALKETTLIMYITQALEERIAKERIR